MQTPGVQTVQREYIIPYGNITRWKHLRLTLISQNELLGEKELLRCNETNTLFKLYIISR